MRADDGSLSEVGKAPPERKREREKRRERERERKFMARDDIQFLPTFLKSPETGRATSCGLPPSQHDVCRKASAVR